MCLPQHSFGKQFYGSVNKTDYATLRLGFIMVSDSADSKYVSISFIFFLREHNGYFHFEILASVSLPGEPIIWLSQVYGTCSWSRFQESCWYQVNIITFWIVVNLLIQCIFIFCFLHSLRCENNRRSLRCKTFDIACYLYLILTNCYNFSFIQLVPLVFRNYFSIVEYWW